MLFRSSISGFGRDPDGDGISNGTEYVLGTGTSAHPTPFIRTYLNGTWLELQLYRTHLRKDVILEIQAADSLLGPWELAARADADFIFTPEPGFNLNQNGPEYRSITARDRIPTDHPGSPRRFMRLKITRK